MNSSARPSFSQELWTTYKKVGLPVFVWLALGGALDQWLTEKMQTLISSPEGLSSWIWLYGLLSVMISVLFPLVTLIWVIHQQSGIKSLAQVIIETLRAWGHALSWSFLFIIPGVIKWLRFTFVPFVTLESETYARGEIDALKASEQLSRGHLGQLILLMVIFALGLPLVLTTWDEYRMIWKTPLASLLLTLVETFSTILFLLLVRRLYKSAAQKLALT